MLLRIVGLFLLLIGLFLLKDNINNKIIDTQEQVLSICYMVISFLVGIIFLYIAFN